MSLPSLLSEFKTFIAKGNVIDLAVGVVIGGAFSKLVDGVVNGLILPVVSLIQGRGSLEALLSGAASLASGAANFLLLAAVVFFIFVKPMNRLRQLEAARKPPPPPPPPTPEERAALLLAEIRDLLKNPPPR